MNLRVMIYDPWGKSAPRKLLNFFGLKHPKMTTPERVGGVGGGVGGTFQKCSFSQNCSFIFQKYPLASWNYPFVFQKGIFIFEKCCIVFQNFPLAFQRCLLSFHCCLSFSKNTFFPTDCTFSSSCSELLREIIFALLLFCFLLELFID